MNGFETDPDQLYDSPPFARAPMGSAPLEQSGPTWANQLTDRGIPATLSMAGDGQYQLSVRHDAWPDGRPARISLRGRLFDFSFYDEYRRFYVYTECNFPLEWD